MPFRTRAQGKGLITSNVFDEGSARPRSPTVGGRGQGSQGRSRGRGRNIRGDRDENVDSGAMPTPNIVELMARMKGLQQTIETLVVVMVAQRRLEGKHQVERGL